MEQVSLKSEYVTIIKEGEPVKSFGGNQNWFRQTRFEYAANQGCGMIAALDVSSYLKGQKEMDFADYERCAAEFLKRHPFTKLFLHEFKHNNKSVFAIGILPNQICRYLNKKAKTTGLKTRFKWNGIHGHKDMYEKMKTMLSSDQPVVWSIYNKTGKLNLYKYNEPKRKYEVVSSTNNHFVTAIGIREQDENGKVLRMVEISSWGKRYFVNYDEYLNFVGNSKINKYCSNIVIGKRL